MEAMVTIYENISLMNVLKWLSFFPSKRLIIKCMGNSVK